MKNFKKNQVVIFVIALMLVTAGYLNFTNQNRPEDGNLLPTSSLADSEQMAAIGDATLVSANQVSNNENNQTNNTTTDKNLENANSSNTQTSSNTNADNTNQSNGNNSTQTSTNSQDSTKTNNEVKQDDGYFTQSRLDRDKMYSQMLENYQKILETDNLASDEKANAQEEIKKINQEKNAIMIAENLIKTKGFEDVVLFINNGNVTGVIKAEKLEEQQIAQLQNIITRELNVKTTKINISNKK